MVSVPISNNKESTSLYNFPSQKVAEKEVEQKAFQEELTKKPHLPAKTNRVLQQQKQNSDKQNKLPDYIGNNYPVKKVVYNVTKLNEATNFLQHAKQEIVSLKSDITNILERKNGYPTPPLTQYKISTLNKRISDTIKIDHSDTKLFNEQKHLEVVQETMQLRISKPPIESVDKLYQIETEIKQNIDKINEVQLKVDAKIVKELDSLDYDEAKENKESDEKQIQEIAHHKKEVFINIAKSDSTQKELLWLMR